MERRGVGFVALVAVSVALAGCGGGSKPATVPAGTTVGGVRVAQVFTVHESEFRLAPNAIRVPRLGYYGFTAVNTGKVPHALAITGHGVSAHTATIAPGKSAQLAVLLQKSGKYTLFDPLDDHRAKGMQGIVRVP